MKKVFVEIKNGFPINSDIQCAIDGFEYLDYEPKGFTKEDVYSGIMDRKALYSPVVGSIDAMTSLFKRIGKLPESIDIPQEVFTNSDLIKRDIHLMSLSNFRELFLTYKSPMFVKPVKTKLFDGILITEPNHLHYFHDVDSDEKVWVSNKLDIVSEHRAYVHKGELKYCCAYNGDFTINPDYNYIKKIIETYTLCPISYTIDVAVLKDGTTELIEINDMWAIGAYGLYCINYAEMLLDRYNEIINK